MNDFTNNPADNFDADRFHVETPEETAARVSSRQLENMAVDMQGRDQAILQTLRSCRYMTTGQVADFGFADHANPSAAQRAANRTMNRLREMGLTSTLDRRIGGVRAGSSSLVWGLTNPGFRLANLGQDNPVRLRNFEPSQQFLKHTLGVSGLYTQLLGLPGITVVDAQFEPSCWRSYDNNATLKPDLYAVTSDGVYEDYWFLELDLATEAPSRVMDKCGQYEAYYNTGTEQKNIGLFPAVAWIVPDEKRRTALKNHIGQNAELRHKELFTVILPDELEALMRKGAGGVI